MDTRSWATSYWLVDVSQVLSVGCKSSLVFVNGGGRENATRRQSGGLRSGKAVLSNQQLAGNSSPLRQADFLRRKAIRAGKDSLPTPAEPYTLSGGLKAEMVMDCEGTRGNAWDNAKPPPKTDETVFNTSRGDKMMTPDGWAWHVPSTSSGLVIHSLLSVLGSVPKRSAKEDWNVSLISMLQPLNCVVRLQRIYRLLSMRRATSPSGVTERYMRWSPKRLM